MDNPATPVDDWHDARNTVLAAGQFDPDRIKGYFTKWTSRFDLFDTERPWRQEPGLRAQVAKPAGLTTLIPYRPAGNAPAFFSDFHTANPGIASAAEAVDALRAARGPKPAWRLLESDPERVATARVARPTPRDVDTWEDYEAVLRTLGSA